MLARSGAADVAANVLRGVKVHYNAVMLPVLTRLVQVLINCQQHRIALDLVQEAFNSAAVLSPPIRPVAKQYVMLLVHFQQFETACQVQQQCLISFLGRMTPLEREQAQDTLVLEAHQAGQQHLACDRAWALMQLRRQLEGWPWRVQQGRRTDPPYALTLLGACYSAQGSYSRGQALLKLATDRELSGFTSLALPELQHPDLSLLLQHSLYDQQPTSTDSTAMAIWPPTRHTALVWALARHHYGCALMRPASAKDRHRGVWYTAISEKRLQQAKGMLLEAGLVFRKLALVHPLAARCFAHLAFVLHSLGSKQQAYDLAWSAVQIFMDIRQGSAAQAQLRVHAEVQGPCEYTELVARSTSMLFADTPSTVYDKCALAVAQYVAADHMVETKQICTALQHATAALQHFQATLGGTSAMAKATMKVVEEACTRLVPKLAVPALAAD